MFPINVWNLVYLFLSHPLDQKIIQLLTYNPDLSGLTKMILELLLKWHVVDLLALIIVNYSVFDESRSTEWKIWHFNFDWLCANIGFERLRSKARRWETDLMRNFPSKKMHMTSIDLHIKHSKMKRIKLLYFCRVFFQIGHNCEIEKMKHLWYHPIYIKLNF